MRKPFLITAAMALAGALVVVTGAAASAGNDASTGGGQHHIAVGVVRLDGAQEVPGPSDPDGSGIFAYAAFGHELCYVLTARNIEPATLAHIHQAPRGVPGGIVVMLEAPTDGFSADCIKAVDNSTPNTIDVLLQSELDAIIANPAGFYANVHNAPFPAGAIRGQLR
jgi:hypothetical protein